MRNTVLCIGGDEREGEGEEVNVWRYGEGVIGGVREYIIYMYMYILCRQSPQLCREVLILKAFKHFLYKVSLHVFKCCYDSNPVHV